MSEDVRFQQWRPHVPRQVTRRDLLFKAGAGFGALALSALLAEDASAQIQNPKSKIQNLSPHFTPTAKSVIWLFMEGGPSHIDLFDPKPALEKLAGQPLPPS